MPSGCCLAQHQNRRLRTDQPYTDAPVSARLQIIYRGQPVSYREWNPNMKDLTPSIVCCNPAAADIDIRICYNVTSLLTPREERNFCAEHQRHYTCRAKDSGQHRISNIEICWRSSFRVRTARPTAEGLILSLNLDCELGLYLSFTYHAHRTGSTCWRMLSISKQAFLIH